MPRNSKKRNNGRRKRRPNKQSYSALTRHSVVRIPQRVRAAEEDVMIPITFQFSFAAAASTVDTKSMKINTLIASASEARTGLSNYSSLFSRYRVVAFGLTVQVASTHSTVTTVFGIAVTNTSAVPASSAEGFAYGSGPGGQLKLASTIAGGSDLVKFKVNSKVCGYEGTPEVETDDSYAAATTPADPANLLYLHLFAMLSSSGTFAARGIVVGHLWVRYFEPKVVSS